MTDSLVTGGSVGGPRGGRGRHPSRLSDLSAPGDLGDLALASHSPAHRRSSSAAAAAADDADDGDADDADAEAAAAPARDGAADGAADVDATVSRSYRLPSPLAAALAEG